MAELNCYRVTMLDGAVFLVNATTSKLGHKEASKIAARQCYGMKMTPAAFRAATTVSMSENVSRHDRTDSKRT